MSDILFSRQIPGLFVEEVYRNNNFSMLNRHFHESLELYFMLSGERYYFIEQDTYHIQSGMAILVNCNQIHKTTMTNSNNGHRCFLLQLDSSVLDRYFSFPDSSSLKDFGERYWGAAVFSAEDWQTVLLLIEMLKKEMDHNTIEGNRLGLLLAMQLVTLFIRSRNNFQIAESRHQISSPKVDTGMYQKVHEIALYLQNHCSSPCPLDDLASQFFISRSYLTRIFKSVTGFTITEYLTICRIRKAKVMLQATNMSITEIAAESGFGNITYFEKVFKKIADCSPLQYRKRLRS